MLKSRRVIYAVGNKRSNESVLDGERGCGGAVLTVGLAEDVGDMGVDRALGNVQLLANLAISAACRDQTQHFDFTILHQLLVRVVGTRDPMSAGDFRRA